MASWKMWIGVAVVIAVLAGVVGWYFMTQGGVGGGGAAGAPQLTGNFKEDAVALGKYLDSQGGSTIKFTVWAAGDPNAVMRMYGIVEGAAKINRIWEENGIKVRLKISTYWEDSFKKLYDEFLSAVPQKSNGDFFVNSYIYIGNLAGEGYILNITKYVKAYWNSVFSDFYAPLMQAAQYNGEYYGVPQDTEARPLYVRKDVAACMGWDLSNLPQLVKDGKFTWHDIFNKALQAKEKGCAKWGLIHRKGSAHPDLMQFIFAFGGKLYDPNTGKLVFDKAAVYKWFTVESVLARKGLLPSDMMEWDWAQQIHPTVVNDCNAPTGCTLFFIGGTWHWTEWQTKNYYYDSNSGKSRPLTPQEIADRFAYILFPAGDPGDKPVTLSQPFMWMIASNAGKDNPRYDELKDAYHELAFLVVVGASDPEINAIHSIISAHVPVRKAAASLLKNSQWIQNLMNMQLSLTQETKNAIKDIVSKTAKELNIKFLADVSYMLDYTHLAPSHPMYPKLADILKDAVDKVIRGSMSPEEAVNYVVQKINANPDLSKSVEVVGSIPT
ncbi:MAG: extracellular solute-binding protein, partial [Desulfurococcales archaeon]|nr:extracellular solute-binding protein [Desulfurococcales archaeon]